MFWLCFILRASSKTRLAAVSFVERQTAGYRTFDDLSVGWKKEEGVQLGLPVDNCWMVNEISFSKARIDYNINNTRKREVFTLEGSMLTAESGTSFAVNNVEGKICYKGEDAAVFLNCVELYTNKSRLLTSDDKPLIVEMVNDSVVNIFKKKMEMDFGYKKEDGEKRHVVERLDEVCQLLEEEKEYSMWFVARVGQEEINASTSNCLVEEGNLKCMLNDDDFIAFNNKEKTIDSLMADGQLHNSEKLKEDGFLVVDRLVLEYSQEEKVDNLTYAKDIIDYKLDKVGERIDEVGKRMMAVDWEKMVRKDDLSLDGGDSLLTNNNLSTLFNAEPAVSKVVEIEKDEKGLFHIKSKNDLQMILDLGKMKVKVTTFGDHPDFSFDGDFVQKEAEGCEERSHHWQNESDSFCMSQNGTFYSFIGESDFKIDSVSIERQYKDDADNRKLLSEESVKWLVDNKIEMNNMQRKEEEVKVVGDGKEVYSKEKADSLLDGKVDNNKVTNEKKEAYEEGEILEGNAVLALLADYRKNDDLNYDFWANLELKLKEDNDGWMFFYANTSLLREGYPVKATFLMDGEEVVIEEKRKGYDIYNRGDDRKDTFKFYIHDNGEENELVVKKREANTNTSLVKVEYVKEESKLATLKDLEGLKPDVDLSGYYTKDQIDEMLVGSFVEYIPKEEGKCFKADGKYWRLENPPSATTYTLNITFKHGDNVLKESVVVVDGKVVSMLNVDYNPSYYVFDPAAFTFFIDDGNSKFSGYSSRKSGNTACIDAMYAGQYGGHDGYYTKGEIDKELEGYRKKDDLSVGNTTLATLADLKGVNVDVDLSGYYTAVKIDEKLAGYRKKDDLVVDVDKWMPLDYNSGSFDKLVSQFDRIKTRFKVDGKEEEIIGVLSGDDIYKDDRVRIWVNGVRFELENKDEKNRTVISVEKAIKEESKLATLIDLGDYYSKGQVDEKVTELEGKIRDATGGDYIPTSNIVNDTREALTHDKVPSAKFVDDNYAKKAFSLTRENFTYSSGALEASTDIRGRHVFFSVSVRRTEFVWSGFVDEDTTSMKDTDDDGNKLQLDVSLKEGGFSLSPLANDIKVEEEDIKVNYFIIH